MNCSHKTETYMKFCPECGITQNRIYCTCGTANALESQYCLCCGQSMAKNTLVIAEEHLHLNKSNKSNNKASLKKLLEQYADEMSERAASDQVFSSNQTKQADVDALFDDEDD